MLSIPILGLLFAVDRELLKLQLCLGKPVGRDSSLPIMQRPLVENENCAQRWDGFGALYGDLHFRSKAPCRRQNYTDCCQCVWREHFKLLDRELRELWGRYMSGEISKMNLPAGYDGKPPEPAWEDFETKDFMEADDLMIDHKGYDAWRCYLIIPMEGYESFIFMLQYKRIKKDRSYNETARSSRSMVTGSLRTKCEPQEKAVDVISPSRRERPELSFYFPELHYIHSGRCEDKTEAELADPNFDLEHTRARRLPRNPQLPTWKRQGKRGGSDLLPSWGAKKKRFQVAKHTIVQAGEAACLQYPSEPNSHRIPAIDQEVGFAAVVLAAMSSTAASSTAHPEITGAPLIPEDGYMFESMDETQFDELTTPSAMAIDNLKLVATSFEAQHPEMYAARSIEEGSAHYFDFLPPSSANSVAKTPTDQDANQAYHNFASLPKIEACVSTSLTLGPSAPGALYIGYTHTEL